MFMASTVCVMCLCVAEVEKQLQGSNTPQLPYKKTHSGSTGNIHSLVLLSEQSSSGNLRCIPNFMTLLVARKV